MPADERDVCALGHRVLDELVVAAARCVMDRRAPVQISTIHVGSVLLNEVAYGGGWIAIPSTLGPKSGPNRRRPPPFFIAGEAVLVPDRTHRRHCDTVPRKYLVGKLSPIAYRT